MNCGKKRFDAFFSQFSGTPEERGIKAWRSNRDTSDAEEACADLLKTYDLNFVTRFFSRFPKLRFLPICPTYSKYQADTTIQE